MPISSRSWIQVIGSFHNSVLGSSLISKNDAVGLVRFSAILWGRLPQHSLVRTDVRVNVWMYGLRYVRKIFGQTYDGRPDPHLGSAIISTTVQRTVLNVELGWIGKLHLSYFDFFFTDRPTDTTNKIRI